MINVVSQLPQTDPTRLRMDMVVIATHSGSFHADDLVAVAMIIATCQKRFPGGEALVCRTRDEKVLQTVEDWCGVIVDVGGIHDLSKGRFDHHQGQDKLDCVPTGTYPYASVGLVHRHLAPLGTPRPNWVIGLDCRDNGFKGEIPADSYIPIPGAKMQSLSWALHQLNPVEDGDFDAAFKAGLEVLVPVLLAGQPLDEAASQEGSELRKALVAGEAAHQAHYAASVARVREAASTCGGAVLVFDRHEPAAGDVLAAEFPGILYECHPSNGKWHAQQIPKSPGSFEGRKPFPATWAGKRGGDLAAVTGVADATFAHVGRFIAGADSREGCVRLAELAALA